MLDDLPDVSVGMKKTYWGENPHMLWEVLPEEVKTEYIPFLGQGQ